ncbi:MAG: response regulator, partial [Ignavibacteriales bacterium]|nr:response regulator [Ignavibacteriales bacterium]
AQTKWFKYEGNPVLDVGSPGRWDAQGLGAPRIVRRGSFYQMWYTGRRGSNSWRIGYATSRDGITWQKSPMNPVLSPTESWEEDHVWLAEVIFSGPQYKMWYNGLNHIGYATSADGRLWRKYQGNPILRSGSSGWDGGHVSWPRVMDSKNRDGLKMWYTAVDDRQRLFQLGYATATDETTWTKFGGNPLLSPGSSGAWDDRGLETPVVLFDGESYEMWYAGTRSGLNIFMSSTGYATSPDGIHWTKDQRNPVLSPGSSGSWDSEAASVGDVLFDGTFYHMWYTGNDYGSTLRIGYAVSPKGMKIDISPLYTTPMTGAVRIAVRVNRGTALSVFAKIKTAHASWSSGTASPGKEVGALELFDDGEHGDSLASDGLYANTWRAKEEALYFVDLSMNMKRRRTLGFEMQKAGVFTTIGPIRYDSLNFLDNAKPRPGDTLLLKLVLRNHGASAIAPSVSASLTPADSFVTEVADFSPTYSDIPPGERATTSGYYRLYINPDCPPNTDVQLAISISSSGIPLWTDRFSVHVFPPWWRTDWAYAFYAVIGLVALYSLRRYEKKKTQLKHQRELERVEAEKLRELDQLKSRFFANISHEFRTPLTLILGPIEKWMEKAFDEDLQKDLGMMQRNARRLLRLINQLLDISKLEAGSMKLQASPGNIVSFARGIAQSFQSVAANKNINLRTESESEEIELYFDRDKVEKILSNLLSNAFKFTAEGGMVMIEIRNCAESVVRDTGIGIPEDELPNIFDRFYQVDGSQTRVQEGTGIGLALVKELVEVHHGTINVKSEIGKGTEFKIQLPLGRAHLKEDEIIQLPTEDVVKTTALEASVVSEGPSDGTEDEQEFAEHKSIILVVEDNIDVRSFIREYLDPSYKVLEARDGDEGVKTAVEAIPDLIISDVMMPKMDGYELCRIVKQDEKTSHIPIILLTAKAGTKNKVEGLETGADDYLVKPFDAKELLVRVRNLIEVRKKLREKFEKSMILKPGEIAVTSMDDAFLKKAMAVVEQHLGDEKFSVERFSNEMNMSRVQLHRKLTALTNQSARDFVRYLRLHRAMDLLKRDAATVAEVAYTVGFSSPAYFTKCFHEQFGFPPSEVKRQPVPNRSA